MDRKMVISELMDFMASAVTDAWLVCVKAFKKVVKAQGSFTMHRGLVVKVTSFDQNETNTITFECIDDFTLRNIYFKPTLFAAAVTGIGLKIEMAGGGADAMPGGFVRITGGDEYMYYPLEMLQADDWFLTLRKGAIFKATFINLSAADLSLGYFVFSGIDMDTERLEKLS